MKIISFKADTFKVMHTFTYLKWHQVLRGSKGQLVFVFLFVVLVSEESLWVKLEWILPHIGIAIHEPVQAQDHAPLGQNPPVIPSEQCSQVIPM